MISKQLTVWLASSVFAVGAAQAHDHGGHHHGAGVAPSSDESPLGVKIEDCWIRALPTHLPSAAYFKVRNESTAPITLSGVQTDAFAHAMLHASRDENGMAKMMHAEPIVIPAGGEFAFKTSNGYHVMLEQARQALEMGSSQTLSFLFDRGGPLSVDCIVKPPSALE